MTKTSPSRPESSPTTDHADTSDDGFITVAVSDIERDTPESVIITLDGIGRDLDLPFSHGQHLTVRRIFDDADNTPVEIRRSYSLCSTAPDGPLRIAVRRIDGGVFSTWATTELTVGDQIDIMAPSGSFTHTLQPGTARQYSLVAAGSGITPIFSIAATILGHEPRSRVDLLYVNRSSSSTMLLDELANLRDSYLDRFRISYLFTQEQTAAALLSGRPDQARFADLFAAGLLRPDVDEVFLCGPEALVDTASAAFAEAGVGNDHIHRELFTSSQLGQIRTAPRPVTDESVVIATASATLHGRTTTVEVYDGDTILEAVERIRNDAPFSCRAGVCSTCQAKMPPGTVSMDVNVGLTDAEVERGFVLTCQARPLPGVAELAVDFDV